MHNERTAKHVQIMSIVPRTWGLDTKLTCCVGVVQFGSQAAKALTTLAKKSATKRRSGEGMVGMKTCLCRRAAEDGKISLSDRNEQEMKS